jgi:ComF family protein
MIATRFARFFGSRCQVCGEPVPDAGPACAACAEALAPRTAGYCPECGLLFADENVEPYPCGRCRANPMPWDSFTFHGPYHGLLGELVRDYKFNSRLELTGLLSSLMANAALGAGIEADLVAPVPLHKRRLRERGFNQSLEMSRKTAAVLGAELSPGAMVRSRFTTPQVKLRASERRDNVKGAFEADREKVEGRRLLLVDDIVTTGGTLLECCKVLKKNRAARVDVLVLARTE